MGFIVTGGNKDPRLSPMRIKSVGGGGGGGSFSSSPFIFYDQTFTYTGSSAVRTFFRFDNFVNGTLNNISKQPDSGGIGSETVSSLPEQFYDSVAAGGGNLWAVRRVAQIEASGSTVLFAATGDNALGIWFNASTAREWKLNRPAAGTSLNTSTFELALAADTTTILARANITLVYVRV